MRPVEIQKEMEGPSLFFFGTCSEPTWQSCATSFRYILYWYYLSAPDDGKKTFEVLQFFLDKKLFKPLKFFFFSGAAAGLRAAL